MVKPGFFLSQFPIEKMHITIATIFPLDDTLPVEHRVHKVHVVIPELQSWAGMLAVAVV